MTGLCWFRYVVPEQARVRLEIFDLRGRRVTTVQRHEATAGEHFIDWAGRDSSGRELASGHYFARLTVRGKGVHEQINRKITILR